MLLSDAAVAPRTRLTKLMVMTSFRIGLPKNARSARMGYLAASLARRRDNDVIRDFNFGEHEISKLEMHTYLSPS